MCLKEGGGKQADDALEEACGRLGRRAPSRRPHRDRRAARRCQAQGGGQGFRGGGGAQDQIATCVRQGRSRLKAVGNENANEEVAAKAVVVQPPKARGRGKPLSPINAVSPTKASEPAAAPEPGPLRRLFFR